MKMKRYVLFNICLITTLLTSMLVGITASQEDACFPGCPENGYCPWLDLDDDGDIDLFDAVYFLKRYGTKGTCVNKTALLYNVSDTFLQMNESINWLLNEMENLRGNLTDLEALVAEMSQNMTEMKTKLAILDATKLGEPDYDSNWTALAKDDDRLFEHDLGTTEIIVYVVGMTTWGGPIHQIEYGGERSGSLHWGVYWHKLTTTEISVYRKGG